MKTIQVEGQLVRFETINGKRRWSCPCDYFHQRTLRNSEDSYCAHIAMAALQCIRAGLVDPLDEEAGLFERMIKAAIVRRDTLRGSSIRLE